MLKGYVGGVKGGGRLEYKKGVSGGGGGLSYLTTPFPISIPFTSYTLKMNH